MVVEAPDRPQSDLHRRLGLTDFELGEIVDRPGPSAK